MVATPRQPKNLLLRQANAILQLKKLMKAGVHYGPPYPGSKKDTLLKPGAEVIARYFGLRPFYGDEPVERQLHIDPENPALSVILYAYRCQMIDIATGLVVGEAIGACSSLEDKYRWRTSKRQCPTCGGGVMKSKYPDRNTGDVGWYCKDCKANFRSDDPVITTQPEGRELNPNPLNELNTVMKLAQKRAFVSSVMGATGASAYFAPGDIEITDIFIVAEDEGEALDIEWEGVETPETFPDDVPAGNMSPATPKKAATTDKKPANPPPPDNKPAPHWLEDEITRNKIAYLLKDLGLVGDNADLWMPKIQPEKPITKLGDTTLNEEQLTARLRQIAAEINKPASAKTKPAGEGWTEDNALQLIDNIWYGFRQVGQDIEKSLGADYKQKFPNPAAAWNAHINTCVLQRVPMYAVRAKYVESEATVRGKKQKQTYIELLTPQPVRAYGRSTTFKGWVGDEFYTEWGIDQWQPGNEYEIGEVCVQYEAKQGYLNATLVSPLPPEEDVDFTDEIPEEPVSELDAFFSK